MSILVTIEHTVEELNSILMALAERPFKEVANLIVKIKSMAEAQMGVTPEAPQATVTADAPATPASETPAA